MWISWDIMFSSNYITSSCAISNLMDTVSSFIICFGLEPLVLLFSCGKILISQCCSQFCSGSKLYFPKRHSSCWSPLEAEGKCSVDFETCSWKAASVGCLHKYTAAYPCFFKCISGMACHVPDKTVSCHCLKYDWDYFVVLLFLFFITLQSPFWMPLCLYWFWEVLFVDILQYFSSYIWASSEDGVYLYSDLGEPCY